MFDPDDSWDMERLIDRDRHREPIRLHHRRPLNVNGTTRSRFEPDATPQTDEALDLLRKAGLL